MEIECNFLSRKTRPLDVYKYHCVLCYLDLATAVSYKGGKKEFKRKNWIAYMFLNDSARVSLLCLQKCN